MKERKTIVTRTNQLPQVDFDLANGVLEIRGKIVPENPSDFFKELDSWVHEYIARTNSSVVVNLHLDYFNTVSSKMLSKFLQKMLPTNPRLNWYYDSEDLEIKEAGEDYAAILNYPINVIPSDN
ncbi:MAG: DUF1987 domain-containing protein [Sediminibacterium sp.]|nr:DUF1987 domain-containing protein [Sediminibacterium sp.]